MTDTPSTPESQQEPPFPAGSRALALVQLVRLPTVFTCVADIFTGFLLTHGSLEPVDTFALIVAVSVCHYWTGMVLNDWFDRQIDAVERPGRPIPSGRIAARAALTIALALNAVGLILAAMAGGNTLLVATALTLCVWLYDGILKKTPLAPVLMGGCRFLNVMLGASASPTGELWCLPQVHVAAGMGLYVAGLTWFARQEASISRRGQLISATFVINVGLATLVAFILHSPASNQRETSLFVLVVIAITIVRRLIRAIAVPTPRHVQTAVRTMLLSLIMLNATMILFATGDLSLSLTVISLLIPALLLSRWIPMT